MSSMPVPPSPMPVSLGAPEGAEIVVPPPPLRLSLGGVALAVCALFLGGLAAFLYYDSPSSRGDWVPIWGALGGACALGAIVAFARRARLRFRARMYQYGFTIDEQAFRFDDLEALALEEKNRLSNGKQIGFDRRIVVRGAGQRAAVCHFVGRIDLLGTFARTLLERATAAAERRLGRGVQGAGWRIDSIGIRAGKSGVTRFDEITDGHAFDGQVLLWRRSEESPFLSVPLGSDNALILLNLLLTRVTPRDAAPAGTGSAPPAPSAPGEPVSRAAATAGEAGRLLFERRTSRALAVLTGLFGLTSIGIPFLWMDAKNGSDLVLAVFLTIAGPFCLYATAAILTGVCRFHQYGVVKKSLFGSRTHRYAAAERMTWAETRMYVNGGYAGNSYVAKIYTSDQKKPLKFGFQRSGSDEDLAYVRDTIANQVAQVMERQIAADGRVPWGGANVSLTKEAVDVRRGKNVERLPYTMPLRVVMHQGVLQLYRPNEKKMVTSVSVRGENFFPGLLLFERNATLVK
jgi:hypothetical protein